MVFVCECRNNKVFKVCFKKLFELQFKFMAWLFKEKILVLAYFVVYYITGELNCSIKTIFFTLLKCQCNKNFIIFKCLVVQILN